MKECVVVLGMHRSGTSVLTGLISFFGGFVGSDLMPPTKDNPKGYFENNKIYQLNEKILRENNTSWHDYSFVVENITPQDFDKYVAAAKAVIEDDLKFVKRTIIKDPRICILFPIWEQALNELDIQIKLVFAFRSPLEVSHSLHKRDDMAIEKGLMLWSHHFLQSELYSRKYKRMIVEYDNDFRDLPLFLTKIGEFVEAEVTEDILQKASEFYSPSLKHHQLTLDNISDDLPSYLNNLITLLAAKDLSKPKKIDAIRDEFSHSKKYYLYDQEHLLKTIEDKEETIRQREQALLEKEAKFAELESAYHAFQEKHEAEHEIFLGTLEELQQEKQKSIDVKNEFNKKDKDRNHQMAVSARAVTDKQSQLDLFKTYFVSGDKLLNSLIRRKASYNKLHNQTGSSSRQKLIKSLAPFAKTKNKRLLKDKIAIIDSGLFSSFFYLSVNPDVKQAGVDPLKHFCTKGWLEGRSPSMEFDVKSYLKKHPDVARARINPLVHYINHGKKEGRKIDPVMFYGSAFTTVDSGIQTSPSALTNQTNNNLLGPIFDGRWQDSIFSISLLKQSKKVVNKNIPTEVIGFSKKQLETLPLKVSVVMPTWNRVNSISKAIDSILAQSYLPVEIIISDDGSTDGTIDLLHEKYPEEISEGIIKILTNNHEGVSAARNSGLNHATGDLIAYLDSDNIWREDYLLIMAAAFSENDELTCAYSALERHDKNNNNKKNILSVEYDRKKLLDANFIDLNVFIHRKIVFDQLGGFDIKLKRLVDWELIIRYTKNYTPALIPFVGVDYFLDDKNLKNITTTVSLDDNRERVYQRHFQERVRYGLETLRIGYVIWDFPALSQTFVMNELRWLVENGFDVKVYFSKDPDKKAELDFEVESYMVDDAGELANLLIMHQRNLCHSQFVYPAVTLLSYPACVKVGINFTFMPHAVDLFHHSNRERNKIGEIVQHPLCLKVFVYGNFHKNFLMEQGVPESKIGFNFQAVNLSEFNKTTLPVKDIKNEDTVSRGLVIARFIEKKGIPFLIDAAKELENEKVEFDVYGYGPLLEEYEEKVKSLKLSNIHFKGALKNQTELAEAYEAADFLIVPSVVAENGDMDGFPTVILEAMAASLPVITTDVSAIPDYLTDGVEAIVTHASDEIALVKGVKRLLNMSSQRRLAMIQRSQSFLRKMVGVDQSMRVMQDTWQSYSIDIFLVTYNTEQYEDRAETFDIIRRIFLKTTTPFTLTIIDNGSDADFWTQLLEIVKGYHNVRLIRKNENKFCGPASNIALEMGDSEFAIYLCSKEGFIKDHGWERALVDYMRQNPDVALGGHKCHVPSYVYGNEYENLPYFNDFRNKEFAHHNSEKALGHVQGGIYILRRDFVEKHGGFSDKVVHNGMDLEMSYYVESLGYKLGKIPEVASLTVKTRPTLNAIMSERTVVAHPLTIEGAYKNLDTLFKENGQRCNICDWKGNSFEAVINDIGDEDLLCPQCNSTSFGRSIYKVISNNHHIHRKENSILLSSDPSLGKMIEQLFNLTISTEDPDVFIKQLDKKKMLIDCAIVDISFASNRLEKELWVTMFENLSPQGEILFSDSLLKDKQYLPNAQESLYVPIAEAVDLQSGNFSISYSDISSYCIGYDWRRIGKVSRHNDQ